MDGIKETLVLFALFLAMVALGTMLMGAVLWFTIHGLLT